MYVFGAKRQLELSTQADLLRDAMFVFEGDFTVNSDKDRIVDTVLGLWSLILSRKESSFEVQLIYSRINTERSRIFPKEYCSELCRLLEEEMGHTPEVLTEDTSFAARRESIGLGGNVSERPPREPSNKDQRRLSLEARSAAFAQPSSPGFAHPALGWDDKPSSSSAAAKQPTTQEPVAVQPRFNPNTGQPLQPVAPDKQSTTLAVKEPLSPQFEKAQSAALVPFRSPASGSALSFPQSSSWRSGTADVVAELRLLCALWDLQPPSQRSEQLAARWCDEQGASCLHDVVDAKMVDEFVSAIALKPIQAKKFSDALQPAALYRAFTDAASEAVQLRGAVELPEPVNKEEGRKQLPSFMGLSA